MHDAGRYSRNCCSGRHVSQNDAAGTDLCASADLNVAEDLRAGSDEHVVVDLGVTIAVVLARGSQCDVVQNDGVVADRCCLSDDNSGCVINENSASDLRGWMNVDTEDCRDASLEIKGQWFTFAVPQRVRNATGLKCVKPLKCRNGVRFDVAAGSRMRMVSRSSLMAC